MSLDDYEFDEEPERQFDFNETEQCSDEEMEAAIEFGLKYDDDDKRLVAIMKNIIANDGLFIPDKKVHKLLHAKREAAKKLAKQRADFEAAEAAAKEIFDKVA